MTSRQVFDGQRGLILAIFLSSLFVNLLILTAPLYMLQLFSRVMTSGSMATLVAISVGAAFALLFFLIFDIVRQKLSARLGARIEASLGPSVMSGLIDDRSVAEAMGAQPLRDLQELRNFVSGPYFTALLDAPWSVIFIGVIFLFHWDLGVIALSGILILLFLGVLNEILGRRPSKESNEATQRANMIADEMIRNADIVRAMGMTRSLIWRWRAKGLQAMGLSSLANDRIALMGSLAKFARMGLQITLLGTGVLLVIDGHLTPGLMMAASILLGRAAAPVEQAIAGWRALMSARQATGRLGLILERRAAADALMELPEPDGHVSVEDATVMFPDLQEPVLFGVSLDLKPGTSLGVIGPSGAGKTTLARALVGLQPLSRGYVRIDDAALTDWPAEQIGRYVGFMPQRVELFGGTVAENIAMMDPDAAPSMIVEAAKRAEVHDLILSLPRGYNTPVGAMGERLSAGQRQRIGLARAFYGDRRLIVLDEPNANLDPEGEEALARAVVNATARGCVVVVVTHRMAILRRVSHAAMMDAGRIVRFGVARDVLEATVRPASGSERGDDDKIAVFQRRPHRLQTAAEGS
ncbi:type I secretion system permease/ATPase [Acidimangrovimonas pyrenivorans]|uniref:Type I secretion system permease/ATPase n=1 Tax=Acidimangrovimonas pyrenivorans TaxID=2030798 RepID=A0ABV7AH54_9RHOB